MSAELLALLLWDDARNGLSASVEASPSSGFVAYEPRAARSPVQVRADREGGLHLLASRELVHLDRNGKVRGRTPLADRVIDYACEPSGCCVVIEAGGRARALDANGAVLWSRAEPPASKVLLDSATYLQSHSEPAIAALDTATGGVKRVIRLPESAGSAFLAGDHLAATCLDDLRYVWSFDLRRNEALEFARKTELFAWLVYPFGLDDAGRVYVWREGRVARISRDDSLEELFAIDGVAVRGHDVFTSHRVEDGVVVEGAGRRVTLAAPSNFRLAAVDNEGRYYLRSADTPAAAGRWLVFSAGGKPEAQAAVSDAIECRLPVHDRWQVEGDGSLIIPVTTPGGLAVIRVLEQRASESY